MIDKFGNVFYLIIYLVHFVIVYIWRCLGFRGQFSRFTELLWLLRRRRRWWWWKYSKSGLVKLCVRRLHHHGALQHQVRGPSQSESQDECRYQLLFADFAFAAFPPSLISSASKSDFFFSQDYHTCYWWWETICWDFCLTLSAFKELTRALWYRKGTEKYIPRVKRGLKI